jgi:hypothetical protein
MSDKKTASPELLSLLAAKGLKIETPAPVSSMTEEQKAERMVELEVQLNEAKAVKNVAEQKKIRRMQRAIMGGPWRKAFAAQNKQ